MPRSEVSAAFSAWACRDQKGGKRSFDRQDERKRFIPRVEADRPVDPGHDFGHRNGDCGYLEAKPKMQVLIVLSWNRKEPSGFLLAVYYLPNRRPLAREACNGVKDAFVNVKVCAP